MIKKITTDDLRRMDGNEGLVLQGCGGELDEWVIGINDLLTEEGILLEGDTFKDVSVFEHDGLTDLLFSMDNVKLDIGKMAMWRLKSHSSLGGTWLSDFVPNKLDGFIGEKMLEQEYPDCPLIGTDGNIYNLMGIASRTLKKCGMKDQAAEMCERITVSGSYDEALNIIGEYVNIVDADDMDESDDFYEDEDVEPEDYGGWGDIDGGMTMQ